MLTAWRGALQAAPASSMAAVKFPPSNGFDCLHPRLCHRRYGPAAATLGSAWFPLKLVERWLLKCSTSNAAQKCMEEPPKWAPSLEEQGTVSSHQGSSGATTTLVRMDGACLTCKANKAPTQCYNWFLQPCDLVHLISITLLTRAAYGHRSTGKGTFLLSQETAISAKALSTGITELFLFQDYSLNFSPSAKDYKLFYRSELGRFYRMLPSGQQTWGFVYLPYYEELKSALVL